MVRRSQGPGTSRLLLNALLGTAFLAAAGVLAFVISFTMRRQAAEEAQAKAQILLDKALAVHAYYSKELKPRLFELTDPFRPEGYFDPSWMSSSYAVRRLDEYFHGFNPIDYYYKDAVVNARNPGNEADEPERAFLRELNGDPELESRSTVRKVGGESYFVFLRRGEILEESCLRCHGDPSDAPADLLRVYGTKRGFRRGPELGTTVSVVSIRIPVTQAYRTADRFAALVSGVMLAVLASLLVLQHELSDRLFFRPLASIRAKALEISADDHHLGETIPVPRSRELGGMATAFNAMSAVLRRDRDLMEERIRTRTSELSDANGRLETELSERRRAESALREALGANEHLMRELQHRAKNSFNMISAMIDLAAASSPGREAREALSTLDSRVRSVAELYSLLYSSGSPASIRVDEYCVRVASSVVALAGNVTLETDLDPVVLSAKEAAPIGLVVNELVTNAVKHAFPGNRRGTILLSLRDADGGVRLEVRDDGIGLPEDSGKAPEGGAMGLGLVRGLAGQLGGTLTIGAGSKGARFTLDVPVRREASP